MAHGIGQVDPLVVDSYWDWVQVVRALHFPLPKHVRKVSKIDEVIAWIEEFAGIRQALPYPTDGMVIKVNSFAQRDRLGTTAKSPRWVVAFKYPPEQAKTKITQVVWQVGRGGTITPVAEMDPVTLSGTTVRRATLHNVDQIRALHLHVGDTVVVEKAGEIIPYIVRSVPERRVAGAHPISIPKGCPSCRSKVEREEGEAFLRCLNPSCPAQLVERLTWFAGRNQMDIEGLGDKLISQLVSRGMLHDIADLYRLSATELGKLNRTVVKGGQTKTYLIGGKVAGKLAAAIDESKHHGFARLLAGIGIPRVGVTTAQALADWAGSMDRLMRASEEEIRSGLSQRVPKAIGEKASKLRVALHSPAAESAIASLRKEAAGDDMESERMLELLQDRGVVIPSLGELQERLVGAFPKANDLLHASADDLARPMRGELVVSKSVHHFLHSSAGTKLIAALKSLGVRMSVDSEAPISDELSGMTIVVTGTLRRFTRQEVTDLIGKHGGKAGDTVSSKTTLVVAGENAGSKLTRAQELGVKVISEDEFLAMVQLSTSTQALKNPDVSPPAGTQGMLF